MYRTVSIHEIEVGERARVDLGDLTELAESIADMGLLQPIVITDDNRLIAGHRRLESCRRLGKSVIEAVVAEHIHDAVDLLKAERDENTCRKPMTASELIALGRQIEELEKPKAKAAQVAGASEGGQLRHGIQPSVPANERLRFDSRERAAAAVGLSTAVYSRIKQVADGAEGYQNAKGARTEVTPERQAESREALGLMDRITSGEEIRPEGGGRPLTVNAVYERWKGRPTNPGRAAPAGSPPTAVAAPPLTGAHGRRLPQRSVRKSINDGMAALSGLCVGFAGIRELPEDMDAEEAALWQRDLNEVLRVLRSFNSLLKEHVNATR